MSKRVANKKGEGSRNRCHANWIHKLKVQRVKLRLQGEDLDKETNRLRQQRHKEKENQKGGFKTFLSKLVPKNILSRSQAR